jgi:hypothetical protein
LARWDCAEALESNPKAESMITDVTTVRSLITFHLVVVSTAMPIERLRAEVEGVLRTIRLEGCASRRAAAAGVVIPRLRTSKPGICVFRSSPRAAAFAPPGSRCRRRVGVKAVAFLKACGKITQALHRLFVTFYGAKTTFVARVYLRRSRFSCTRGILAFAGNAPCPGRRSLSFF